MIMPTNIDVPALGDSIAEAVLLKWHKNDGDAVAAAEPVAELETDKANVDVPSPAAGVFRRVKKEGDTVKIGETIARVDEGSGGNSKSQAAKPAAPETKAATPSPAPSTIKPQDLRPSVRTIVEEKKLNAADIKGTGPGGKITKEDATQAASSMPRSSSPAATSSTAPSAGKAPPPSAPGARPSTTAPTASHACR